ncbi:MAG: M23 family metallopeptidase [Candidatus Eiseniibacteriota bacterium]|nr:MAG: M23 family metallopeptidase [Candidatus Eisenbacteria bacterium]
MKIGRHRSELNVILVPPGGGKPSSFTLGRRGMMIAAVVLVGVLGLVVFSLRILGEVGRSSLTISRLKRENARLKQNQGKLATLEDELARLRVVERRMAKLMGIERQESEGERPPASASLLGSAIGTSGGDYSGRMPTLWPVHGEISRGFSEERGGHKGIDIAVARETPVRGAGDGAVDFAGKDEVFGNMIILNHGSGISSLYGHNSSLTAKRGDAVHKGQIIAYSGSSGRSSAPHLHFEISRYGRQVDPLTFLSEQ